LTINGTGELTAQVVGNYMGAGIGGAAGETNGNITITSGTVTAKSTNGAGIGGGFEAAGGNITITGGNVTAESGNQGAGIGGGYNGAGGTVIISGGTVTAISGGSDNSGRGIGGGALKDGGTLIIKGGTIIARARIQDAFSGTVSFNNTESLTGYNYTTANFDGSSPTGPVYTSSLSNWIIDSSKWVKIECNP
jgi:hypothetical protein